MIPVSDSVLYPPKHSTLSSSIDCDICQLMSRLHLDEAAAALGVARIFVLFDDDK